MRVTRTRRTYVIAAAVAAIVTAANASQGAYFSQSWGWVALAFLVPTTVLLILDRVEAPGRLRVAFASLMALLGVWIMLSAIWSISSAASIAAGLALSVFAIWSLVGNQALFAGREALARRDWVSAREHGRRAESVLFWSAEPELVLGDAAAGLGDRQAALQSYRKATMIDLPSWVAWLRLAQVARGPERAAAYRTVHKLDPLEEGLPGE